MKRRIENFLKEQLHDAFLPISIHQKAVETFNVSYYEVEEIALGLGISPLRYKRNQTSISVKQQLKLLRSHVMIVGCGGLGGHVAEILARIGVGALSLVDFDVFEEHNLNRQNFSNLETLGQKKAHVVKQALECINPSLHVKALIQKFSPLEDSALLEGCDVVVDALDSPLVKVELAQVCQKQGIAFVHGAIAGMNGQFSTCSTLEHLYRDGGSGIETTVGNPSFSVTFAASIQSAEVIKTILGIGETLKEKILITNLLENEFVMV